MANRLPALMSLIAWLCCCGRDGGGSSNGTGPSSRAGEGEYIEFGSTPAQCDRAPTPCGGDVSGSWALAQACHSDRRQLYADDECISLSSYRTRATGAIYIRSDGSVASSISGHVFEVLNVASNCITSSCQSTTFTSGSAECSSTTGECKCEFNRLLDIEYYFQDVLPQQLRDKAYCVIGDRLILEDPDFEDGTAITFERIRMPDIGPTATTLMEAEVEFSTHCCTWPPSVSNRSSRVVTAQVTPQVEFPGAHEYDLRRERPTLIPHSVDVDATTVIFTYFGSSALAKGDFNGWRLAFSGPHFDRIVDAQVIDGHIPDASPKLSFDERILYVSADGGEVLDGDWLAVQLTLQ